MEDSIINDFEGARQVFNNCEALTITLLKEAYKNITQKCTTVAEIKTKIQALRKHFVFIYGHNSPYDIYMRKLMDVVDEEIGNLKIILK